MRTRKRGLAARLSAALLALVMVMTLAPTALAVNGCSANNNGAHEVTRWEPFVTATCHTPGVRRGVCSLCNQTVYDEIGTDRDNHEAVYTDEGNGYHTGVCSYHKEPVSIRAEAHTFNNGVCTKCAAMDYSNVKMNMPANLVVPVPHNGTDVKLSVGEIRLTLGSANITDDYTIYYNWYYEGSPVASTAEYTLPASITAEEGTYKYTLFVSAVSKNAQRANVSGSCDVTVRVEDLITASATLSTDDSSLYLGDPDTWSGESVSSQIYAAVQELCPRDEYPDYMVFHTLPDSTVGRLVNVNTGVNATSYYFDEIKNRKSLDDVEFQVATGANATTGDYKVEFTAYDTDGGDYPGVLTITVQQYAGDMDVVLTTARTTPISLSAEDFEDFWTRTYPNGELVSISFKKLPYSTEGTLKADYVSTSASGEYVKISDVFYAEPSRRQYGIDAVTFIPGVKQVDYVALDFTAEGYRNNGKLITTDGTLYIFLTKSGSADVTVTAAAAGTALNPADFQKAYQSAMGGTGTNFYIQLLEVPARGELYVNRTATRDGTLLTARNVASYPFSYSTNKGETISSVTYVPAAGTVSESIRYVACSTQGKPLYTGKITFTSTTTTTTPGTTTTSGLTLPLTSPSTGVKLPAGSFENLVASKLTMVSFTPPSPSYGALYYGMTDTAAGTRVTSSNSYFSTATSGQTSGTLYLSNLTFVPTAGFTGIVPIPFTALDSANVRYTGTLRITVTAGGTTTPGTTTPGTTTPGTTTPGTTAPGTTTPTTPKTFTDVAADRWSYPYITELTTSGALSGDTEGTFRPEDPVKLGEALKLMMWVINPTEYGNLAPTDSSHWASGYLDRAIKDGLLPADVNKDLNRSATRYTIAEIATKAMKLTPVENATVSPFMDMPLTNASAKYVLPLYTARIITGDTNKAGQPVFYGINAIKREEFATIVWRMQSYLQNGFVGTISAS